MDLSIKVSKPPRAIRLNIARGKCKGILYPLRKFKHGQLCSFGVTNDVNTIFTSNSNFSAELKSVWLVPHWKWCAGLFHRRIELTARPFGAEPTLFLAVEHVTEADFGPLATS